MKAMTTNKKLIKSTGIIGLATTTSRVLGFVRDILFARLFGTNIYAQAFVVAFRLPNMLRDMVGEGATDAAIVPVLTEYQHTRTKEEYWEVARIILNLMLVLLVIISVAGVIFAPLLVKIIAPGFLKDPHKYAVTVSLTRLVFPYIFFLGLVAYAKGVLNSFHYFITPAFAPAILNISIILAIFWLCPFMGVNGLVVGILIGGFLQVLMQLPPLYSRGFRIKDGFRLIHPISKRIGKLLLPRAFGTAIYQMSVLVDTIFGSFSSIVGYGAVAGLYFAQRLFQLPLAVFGISLATAVLPRLSKEVATNDMGKFKDTVSFSLRTVFTVMVPAAVGLMILSSPIIRILFQRGEFTSYSTAITSNALFFYTFGLFAYAGIKILVGAYYSMGDTRTPVKTASFSLAVNVILNLILMHPLKIGGLALATSIAAITNFSILYVLLVRRIGDIGTKIVLRSFIKIFLASAVMGIFSFFMAETLLSPANSYGMRGLWRIGVVVISSGAMYAIVAYLFRVEGIRRLWGLIVKR